MIESCVICGSEVKVQIFKNKGLCSALCEKKRDGKTPKQADIKSVVE